MKCKYCDFKNPPDKQFCQNCIENLYDPINLSIMRTPSWVSHTKRLLATSRTKEGDMEAQDKAAHMRQHEMKIDAKARNWEESRKAALKRDKPAWVKKGRKLKDLRGI